jgi:hypothetical protein
MGGFTEDFFGGGNAVEGLSPNTSERVQRLGDSVQRQQLQEVLDAQALRNFFLTGQFQQGQGMGSRGKKIFGSLTGAPTGPAGQLVTSGLQNEVGLSGQRQDIANQLLGVTPGNIEAQNQFNQGVLGFGQGVLPGQAASLLNLFGTSGGIQDLGGQLTGGLQDFFASGGAPSEAQATQIGTIFDAQREVGTSNLQQQFGDAIQQLLAEKDRRGLRFGDTPIQDRGNRLTEELARNLTNLETSLGGQQANALLEAPFRQATLGGQLQGQQQNQLQNIFNAFSTPVTQGFNAGNQLFPQTQFAAQFSPAQFASPALQNAAALVGGGQFAQGLPTFAPIGIPQNPTFGQTFGQTFASSLGSELGSGIGSGLNSAFSAGVVGQGGGPGPTTSATNSFLGGGGGSAGGAGAAAAFSHPDLKEDLVLIDDDQALDDVRQIPIYEWRYRGESTRHLGGLTTDMPDAVIAGDPATRRAYDFMSYLGLLTAAIRALDTHVQAIKEQPHAPTHA